MSKVMNKEQEEIRFQQLLEKIENGEIDSESTLYEQYHYLSSRSEKRNDPDVFPWYCLLKYMLGIPMTLTETGTILQLTEEDNVGVSRERVRQIETKVCKKIGRRYSYSPDEGLSLKTLKQVLKQGQPQKKDKVEIPELVDEIHVLYNGRDMTFYKSVVAEQYYRDDGRPLNKGYIPTPLRGSKPETLIMTKERPKLKQAPPSTPGGHSRAQSYRID